MNDRNEDFIGAVIYRRGDEPGTLDADWVQSTRQGDKVAKGWATGGPADGFVGHYSIRYETEQGQPGQIYDMTIDRSGEIFHLSWSREGLQLYQGIGMLLDDAIVAGWGPVR